MKRQVVVAAGHAKPRFAHDQLPETAKARLKRKLRISNQRNAALEPRGNENSRTLAPHNDTLRFKLPQSRVQCRFADARLLAQTGERRHTRGRPQVVSHLRQLRVRLIELCHRPQDGFFNSGFFHGSHIGSQFNCPERVGQSSVYEIASLKCCGETPQPLLTIGNR